MDRRIISTHQHLCGYNWSVHPNVFVFVTQHKRKDSPSKQKKDKGRRYIRGGGGRTPMGGPFLSMALAWSSLPHAVILPLGTRLCRLVIEWRRVSSQCLWALSCRRLAACTRTTSHCGKGPSAYTNSQGLRGVCQHVVDYITARDDGNPSFQGDVFETNGASVGIVSAVCFP
jgi:hypothetical protein